MPAVNPDVQKWVELSIYDLGTADAMLTSGRYVYVLFCSQQAIEKRLKAEIVQETDEFPPRTHDLYKLARHAKIPLSEEQDLFLRTLTKYYIGTRYPEEISSMAKEATKALASQGFMKTKEFLVWLDTLKR